MRLNHGAVCAAIVAVLITAAPYPSSAADGECDFSGWQSECSVENSGEQVDIGASITNPRTPDRGGSDSARDEPVVTPPPPPPPLVCGSIGRCDFIVPPENLTVADIASFRPSAPSLTGEPVGFGIVGAPTNVVAAASEQYLTGPLLDWNVTVRFVPAGYVFDYGDGTIERFTTGGTSWASLGQAQFTPTSTSHVYRERGSYPVGVTVQYSASVDFGSGTWRPVTGFVTAASGGYDVRVVEARTALVDKSCLENPDGPGC